MKNLGRIDLVKHQISREELKKLIGKHETVKVQFAMALSDIEENASPGTSEGMNYFLDQQMKGLCPTLIGDLSDIDYELTGFEKKTKTLAARVIITATASTSELFPDDLDDEDQEERPTTVIPAHPVDSDDLSN